jgi:hypothetical protein
MPLGNNKLLYYDHNVLRLTAEKRTEYHAQANRLITNLTAKLHDNTKLKVKRVLKAGSFAKFTILRKAEGRSADVDIAFYLGDKDASKENVHGLNDQIYDFLLELYPNKRAEDFEVQRKATSVGFVGSGLDIDVVPMIQDSNTADVGWQFGKDGSVVKTNVPGQLNFLVSRKNKDAHYRTLVRLVKQWKHYCEVPGLKGYSLELITAFLLDKNGSTGTGRYRLL